MTPTRLQPGIGLRPGEWEHPAAATLPVLYAALWESVAAHARLGLNVVVDIGLYDIGIAAAAARRLEGIPVLFVGVRCDVETIMQRRRSSGSQTYGTSSRPKESRFRSRCCAGRTKCTLIGPTTSTWILRPTLQRNALPKYASA